MEKTLSELAEDIINEIEREDFIYAMKHYGGFKVKTTVKQVKKWWDDVDSI